MQVTTEVVSGVARRLNVLYRRAVLTSNLKPA